MKVFVDLDDTLCFPNHSEKPSELKYGEAAPNWPMIEHIRSLHSAGNHITIWTARRMLTHIGDVERVIADIGQLTRDWLAKYAVPYDEIIFGKPYYDLIIDDKARGPEINEFFYENCNDSGGRLVDKVS
jgi:capsule biosynthesis phosphatase